MVGKQSTREACSYLHIRQPLRKHFGPQTSAWIVHEGKRVCRAHLGNLECKHKYSSLGEEISYEEKLLKKKSPDPWTGAPMETSTVGGAGRRGSMRHPVTLSSIYMHLTPFEFSRA